MIVARLSRVTVRFGRTAALSDVSLDVDAGQVTGVVGGDGAGKTTLLRVLAGVQRPSSGDVHRPPATGIGYLASASGTYPDLSVAENLQFVARAYGVRPAEARRRAAEHLEQTGLAASRDRLVAHLSGGMRQKLGLIQALLHRPALLVLDEPTTGIDPVSRADLWRLIARAAADGAAVVFSTTYLDEAERAGHLLVLGEGEPLAAGRPAGIAASVPGAVQTRDRPPRGDDARRAWRRRASWRVWDPDAEAASPPDLSDALTALALRRELAATGGGRKGRAS